MNKKEYIKRYGQDAYDNYRAKCNAWNAANRESVNKYREKWYKKSREKGWTPFCPTRYNEIENYETALQDKFTGWVCHHRNENYFSQKTLKDYNMYYNVDPTELIWLREEEHRADAAVGNFDPTKTVWHKKSLEIFGKDLEEYKVRVAKKTAETWSKNEKYLKNEGKHQLQDDDQKRAYQREYHRQWYLANKEKHKGFCKASRERRTLKEAA